MLAKSRKKKTLALVRANEKKIADFFYTACELL